VSGELSLREESQGVCYLPACEVCSYTNRLSYQIGLHLPRSQIPSSQKEGIKKKKLNLG